MLQITPQMRILVALEAVDGRKGIDSLARLCQEKLEADPFSGCLFFFRSRRGTAIRILVYDGQGFWLAQKRLSKGRFRWWPEGRNTREVARSLAAHLGVGFVSLTEALDLTTPAGRAMAALLAVFAEFAREILRERVRAGLAHARQNGQRLGRPATAGLHADKIRKLYRAGTSKSEIARRLRIGRTSVRRILQERWGG